MTELHGRRVQVVATAGAAIVLLLAATALGMYKPRGLTTYEWRQQRERSRRKAGR